MKDKAFLLFLLGMLSCGILSAQTGNVKGTIIDAQTREGIPFANVVLVHASDSTQVMGMASSDSGRFEFKRVPKGRYFIQAAVLAYHRNNSMVFEISGQNLSVDVGIIPMTSTSVHLDEVVVSAKRPIMEMEAGKLTMNISQSIVTQSDNAFEMLKKFPGVTVDKDDNISLNGQSGVMVMVDDRPTHMDGQNLANYLRSMPGNTIEKIEVMTNPSSKYDAEGTGGIINLKTTRIHNTGFSGSVDAGIQVNRNLGYNAGFDLNYRHKKFTVYGSFSAYQGNHTSTLHGYNHYADGSRNTINAAERNQPASRNRYLSFYGKGGIDYYIGKQDVLSLSYKGSGGQGNNDASLYRTRFYGTSDPDSVLYAYNQEGDSRFGYQNHNVNLNYEHTFDTAFNRKLSMNFDYIRNERSTSGSNHVLYYPGDFLTADPVYSMGYDVDQPFTSNIYSFKADYSHPFNMQTSLEAGVKFSYADNNTASHYLQSDSSRLDDRYLYDELIAAAYIMVNHTFKTRTTLQVGVRAEYTYSHGNNVGMDSVNTSQYARPFPNVSISQPIGNKNHLTLSYRYRLTRPDYSDLNPFQIRSTATEYYCGNPYLKPEYSHNLDLTYSFNYKFFATLGYLHATGDPEQITFYDAEHNAYTQPINAGLNQGVTLSLSTNLTFYKIWRLMVFVHGGYGQSVIDYNETHQKSEVFEGSYWINTEVDATPNLTFSAYSWGQFPNQSNFTYSPGLYGGGIGIKAFFLKKTLTLSASFDVMFNDYTNRSVYPAYNGMENINYIQAGFDKYSGSIRLSWRFGNNKLMNRAPRQIQDADESSRLNSGGAGSGSGGAGPR